MQWEILDHWLEDLDFAYWSSGQHKILPQVFFEQWARGEAVLLDVRSNEEAAFVRFPFALHIPLQELPRRVEEVPRDKLVATFCSGMLRAAVAFVFLQSKGFRRVRILKGGYPELLAELVPGRLRQWLPET